MIHLCTNTFTQDSYAKTLTWADKKWLIMTSKCKFSKLETVTLAHGQVKKEHSVHDLP